MKRILPQHIDINKIDGLGIYELRNLARSLGVPRPTTFRRDELIANIRKQIQTGSALSSNAARGRPPRDFSLDVSKLVDSEPSYLTTVLGEDEPSHSVRASLPINTDTRTISGFVHLLQSSSATLIGNDMNGYKIPGKIVSAYSLAMGDYIEAKAVYNDAAYIFIVEEVIQINGATAQLSNTKDAVVHFDDMEGERPAKPCELDGIQFKLGQRILLSSTKSFDRIEDIAHLNDANRALNNAKAHTVALLVEETDDSARFLMDNGIDVYLSKVNFNIKKQFMACLFSLFKAKQLAEQGKTVIFFLDSLTKLFKIYNNSVFPDARINIQQVNLPSIADLKTFFLSCRQLKNGGSLTMLAYAAKPNSDMEEYIYNEFADLANIIVERTD